MTRLAVTPCCGVILEPHSKREKVQARALLRQGICPACKTDLKETPTPDDPIWTFRGKRWFQCNAYRTDKGIWQWSDVSALIFRDMIGPCQDDPVRDDVTRFFVYDVYTEYVDCVGAGESNEVLALKRARAWFDETTGAWRIPAAKAGPLVEALNGFYVYPSVLQAIEACKAHYTL
jgi:hypothetical protein